MASTSRTAAATARTASKNGTPDFNNFAPRVAIAWSPERLHGNTVIRAGGGIYYGDAQIGNQLAFTYNGGNRFNLAQLTTPGLAYPVDLNPDVAAGTAPDETERYPQERNESTMDRPDPAASPVGLHRASFVRGHREPLTFRANSR